MAAERVALSAQADRVSSVSGGSITNGVLALNWSKLRFDANGFAAELRPAGDATHPPHGFAVDRCQFGHSTGFFGGIPKHVADHYNQYLFNHAKLQDLPDDADARASFSTPPACRPECLWRFSKPFMGDWKVGLVMNPDA